MTSISPKIPIVNKIHKAAIIELKRKGVINNKLYLKYLI